MSAPPQKAVKIAPGKLFFSNTPATIFVIAIVTNGVVGAPFLTTELPQTRAIHAFHPRTAHGKLNAVITPTTPRGFHVSNIIWLGRSDGMTDPFSCRLNPTAKSSVDYILEPPQFLQVVFFPSRVKQDGQGDRP
nr:Uncharacterised protein [Ipomoea batatas]